MQSFHAKPGTSYPSSVSNAGPGFLKTVFRKKYKMPDNLGTKFTWKDYDSLKVGFDRYREHLGEEPYPEADRSTDVLEAIHSLYFAFKNCLNDDMRLALHTDDNYEADDDSREPARFSIVRLFPIDDLCMFCIPINKTYLYDEPFGTLLRRFIKALVTFSQIGCIADAPLMSMVEEFVQEDEEKSDEYDSIHQCFVDYGISPDHQLTERGQRIKEFKELTPLTIEEFNAFVPTDKERQMYDKLSKYTRMLKPHLSLMDFAGSTQCPWDTSSEYGDYYIGLNELFCWGYDADEDEIMPYYLDFLDSYTQDGCVVEGACYTMDCNSSSFDSKEEEELFHCMFDCIKMNIYE